MTSDEPEVGAWYDDGYRPVQVTAIDEKRVYYHVEGDPDRTWLCYRWVWDEYGMVREKEAEAG